MTDRQRQRGNGSSSIGRELYRKVHQLGRLAELSILLVVAVSGLLVWQQLAWQLNEQARQGAALIDEYILNIEIDLNTIAKYLATTDDSNRLFRSTLVQKPNLHGLYLVAQDGTVLAQQQRISLAPRARFDDQPWLGQVRKGETYVGTPVHDDQPLPHLMLAVAVPNASGQFAQSLVAHIELTKLWTQINALQVGNSGRVFAVDAHGHIVLHRKLAYTRSVMPLRTLYPYQLAGQPYHSMGILGHRDGSFALALTVPSARTDLVVIAEQPLHDLLFGLAALIGLSLLAVTGVVLFVQRAQGFTQREIVEPLASLRHSASRFEQGDLMHRSGAIGRYELAEISVLLDQMAARLGTTLNDLHQRVSELDASMEFLQKIADSVPGVMFRYRRPLSDNAHFSYISPRVRIFGLTAASLAEDATPFFERLHPDDREPVWQGIDDSAATLSLWRAQFRIRLPSGDYRWFEGQAIPDIEPDGSLIWFGYFADIQTQKETEEQIRKMAQHDTLTGLPNRALFDDRVAQALADAQRHHFGLALMFIDLDRFKPVNDTFGHRVGDLLLRDVARRLVQCVRESDTVARIGGDEFVVLLRQVQQSDQAFQVAEKIRSAMVESFLIEGYPINISASIGIALYPDHGTSAIALAQHADDAMYRSKDRGRNTISLSDAGTTT